MNPRRGFIDAPGISQARVVLANQHIGDFEDNAQHGQTTDNGPCLRVDSLEQPRFQFVGLDADLSSQASEVPPTEQAHL